MGSRAQCTWPITGCLVAAEQFVGPDRVWSPVTETQTHFLNGPFARTRGVPLDVLEAMSSRSANEVMRWLAERSFNIQIEPFGPNEFGAASVLDVLLKWLEGTAERTETFGHDRNRYPGVKMRGPVQYYETRFPGGPNDGIIVQVPTQDDRSKVFLAMLDQEPQGEFGLIETARALSESRRQSGRWYDSLIFPMIHLEEERELEWLIGLWTHNALAGNQPTSVVRAVQMNRLRMNEEGVRAQSAATIVMRTLSIPNDYRIDRPFLFWIERDGVTEPLYTAWLDYDSWKDPGGLQ